MSAKIWIPLVLLVAGAAGIGAGRLLLAPVEVTIAPLELESGTLLEPPRPLPAFELSDERGLPAGPGGLQGRWSLVFFGFTHCPEACPTTLGMLSTVRRSLAGSVTAANVPGVVLVSVDPERDTPGVLAAYLAGFGDGFSGLTGDLPAVRSFATALGVPFRKVPMGDDYMLDHSTAIMLVDPAGRLAALFTSPHDAEALQRDLATIIAASL